MKKTYLLPLFIILSLLAYLFWYHEPREQKCSFYSMGGISTEIKGYYTSRASFKKACGNIQTFFEEMENEISIYRKGSFISRLNDQKDKTKIHIPEHTMALIKDSLMVSEKTNGYFDITVLPLIDLWVNAEKTGQVPSQAEIARQLESVSYKKIILNEKTRELIFRVPGIKIDFGAIAKGYMGDIAAQIMQKEGIQRGLINCGGGIVVYDQREKPTPFHIQIFNPDETPVTHENPNVAELTNGSIQTSGDYNRFHEIQGKKYSHIIDPHSGEPSGSCHSITVKGTTGSLADAYGTGFCAMIAAGKDPMKLKIPGIEILQIKKR